MKKIEKYVADDGREFTSEHECLLHEQAVKILRSNAFLGYTDSLAYTLICELLKTYRIIPLVDGKTQAEIQRERIYRAIVIRIDHNPDMSDPCQAMLQALLIEGKITDAEREAFN